MIWAPRALAASACIPPSLASRRWISDAMVRKARSTLSELRALVSMKGMWREEANSWEGEREREREREGESWREEEEDGEEEGERGRERERVGERWRERDRVDERTRGRDGEKSE